MAETAEDTQDNDLAMNFKSPQARYFVMKCDSIGRLYTASETCVWACADRVMDPQPRDVLSKAFAQGPVILIFSVNKCHGWHGVASMTSSPGNPLDDTRTDSPKDSDNPINTLEKSFDDSNKQTEVSSDQKETTSKSVEWHRFGIKWHTLFLREHGDQCLSFSKTDSLCSSDGNKVNKARNVQELSCDTGKILTEDIAKHYQVLSEAKQRREDQKRVSAFFDPGSETDQMLIWEQLVEKVKAIGTVLLACAYGSQRYNLHTPKSDLDMFVVYAAPTTQILGFSPPPKTIKNRDDESCDYTIVEVQRYCELLLAGDPQCVETLFLESGCPCIYKESDHWRQLAEQHRQGFLTRQCADKYLSDACGGKGLKLLDKWEMSGVATSTPMSARVGKLFYIILRLLGSARDVIEGSLRVYRSHDNPDRARLLDVRRGEADYNSLREDIKSSLEAITEAKSKMLCQSLDPEIKRTLEQWLIDVRIKLLEQNTS